MNTTATTVVALFAAILWHQSQLRGGLPLEPLRQWEAPTDCSDEIDCLNQCYAVWDTLPDATKANAWCGGPFTGKAGTGPDENVDPSVPLE